MSRPIDEKIVKMSLDNSDFKSKATETVGIFGKLGQVFGKVKNLNLSKSTASLGKLQDTANRTNLQKLVDGVGTVTTRFSALSVIAMTALQNITNRAINAGTAMVKSFTIDPIKQGFNEYELKMKSIQTIMSNTQGQSTLEDVTKTLGELNEYADKTIYSFADMTHNIGQFTTAGVSLEDSATAIKGISNLAAVSGSNTQQASTAMYQLSQALSSGRVSLMDWNSVVNAGMGGKVFQNALEETAKKLGKGRDMSVSFRDSLKDGWLTTDVLLSTLQDFAKDESMLEAATKVRTFTQLVDTAQEAVGSGWAQTWEYIFGDFEQAGDMWTSANDALSKIIDNSAKARNALIGGFVELGGRNSLINIVSNSFKALTKVLGTVKESFRNVFPPMTSERLLEIVKGIENFTSKLIMSEETTAKVSRIFEAFFSVLKLGWDGVVGLGKALASMIPPGLGGNILDIGVFIADWVIHFTEAVRQSDFLTNAVEKLRTGVRKLTDFLKPVGGIIKGAFGGSVSIFQELWRIAGPSITALVDGVKEFISAISFQNVVDVGVIGLIIASFSKIKDMSGLIGEVVDKIKGMFEGWDSQHKNVFGVFDTLKNSLESLTGALQATTLMQIAIAIGVMAVSIKTLAGVDAADLGKSMAGITGSMVVLMSGFKSISQNAGGIKGAIAATTVLPALATSILIMAGALRMISSLDIRSLTKGMAGLVTIVASITASMTLMSRYGGKIGASSLQLVALATSVVILSAAVKKLSEIKGSSLAKGLGAMGVILLELGVFMRIADKAKISMGSALAVAAIAGTMHILVGAIKQISDIPVKQVVKGVGTIGILLAQVALFGKFAGGAGVMTASVGMVAVAGAIRIMVPALEDISRISAKDLVKGLGTIAIVLTEVVVALRFAQGSISGAAAIVLVAHAIDTLVGPLTTLGKMSIKEIATSLGVLAGAFTVIGVAAKLLGGGTALVLLAFAAAATGVGIALLGVSAGITAFGIAFAALAGTTASTVKHIIGVFGLLLDGVIELAPKFAQAAFGIITSFSSEFAKNSDILFNDGINIVLNVLRGIRDNISEFAKVGTDIIVKLLNAMEEHLPRIAEAGSSAMIEAIDTMATRIDKDSPKLVAATMRLVGAMLVALVDGLAAFTIAIFGMIPGVETAVTEFAEAAKDKIRTNFLPQDTAKMARGGAESFIVAIEGKEGSAGRAAGSFAKAASDGMGSRDNTQHGRKAGQTYIDGVNSGKRGARTAGEQVAQSGRGGMTSVNTEPAGKSSGRQYISGLQSGNSASNRAGKGLAESGRSGARSVSLEQAGRDTASGFGRGMSNRNILGSIWNAGRRLANSALSAVRSTLGIQSPSRVLMAAGVDTVKGFAIGLSDKRNTVTTQAQAMADNAMNAIIQSAQTINGVLNDNLNLQPVITPIIDLSNFNPEDFNPKVPRFGSNLSLRNLDAPVQRYGYKPPSESGYSGAPVEYHAHITTYGDLPEATVRKMAERFDSEFTRMADRNNMNRGEAVSFQ